MDIDAEANIVVGGSTSAPSIHGFAGVTTSVPIMAYVSSTYSLLQWVFAVNIPGSTMQTVRYNQDFTKVAGVAFSSPTQYSYIITMQAISGQGATLFQLPINADSAGVQLLYSNGLLIYAPKSSSLLTL